MGDGAAQLFQDPLGLPLVGAIGAASPDAAVAHCALLAALDSAQPAAIAWQVADTLGAGATATDVARTLLAWGARRDAAVSSIGWLAACDAIRIAIEGPDAGARSPLVAAGVALASELAARPPSRAGSPARRDTVLRQVAAAPGDLGILAAAAARLCDLDGLVGAELAGQLWGCLATAVADQRPQHPWSGASAGLLAGMDARLQAAAAAEDEGKGSVFAEAKFRPHLLDSAPDVHRRAWWKAVEFGVPHGLLAASLGLAAADRVLRFDAAIDADPTAVEGWPHAAWLLVVVSAVRRLRPLLGGADWLRLATFAAGLVHANRVLDDRSRVGRELPEPDQVHATWDHGPEIARVVAHLQAGRGERAMAAVRSYHLLVLPEQPLLRQVLEAACDGLHTSARHQALGIAILSAAVDETNALGQHPHRERVLCAALRAIAASWAVPGPGTLAFALGDGRRGNSGARWRVAGDTGP